MVDEDFGTKLEVERLKWQRERDAEDRKALNARLDGITEALKPLTRKPLAVELHDGSAHVACPNCGVDRDIPIDGGAPKSYDDVLTLLTDAPHAEAGGKGVLDCPSCRPKLTAKLEAIGYVPKPKPTPEES